MPDLTAERLRKLLHYDPETGIFTRTANRGNTKVGWVAGSLDNRGYRCVTVDGRRYKCHRLAWLYVYGVWPSGVIDHVDHNTDNNRISNLRDTTLSQNMQNMQNRRKNVNNTSGYRGVWWYPPLGKWCSKIGYQGSRKHLGYFDSPDAAYAAYLAAAARLHTHNPLVTSAT